MTTATAERTATLHRDVIRACDRCENEVCEQCRLHADPEQQHEGRKCPDYARRAVAKPAFAAHRSGDQRGMRKRGYAKSDKVVACHPGKPHYARGLCRSCYDKTLAAKKGMEVSK